jgi:cytochrome c oxidase subunit II
MQEFWLPENVATFGGRIDALFMLILVITGIVFVGVQVTLVVFLVRYRRREGRPALYTHGNRNLELIWTGATAVTVLTIAFLSRDLWLDLKDPVRFPPPDFEVLVQAKQFEWNVTYPGADGLLGTDDDYLVRNQLHVPVNATIHVHLESEDVIHSFFVPELRVKQDALPGMRIPTWFEATRAGEFQIGCAELCGLAHYRMRGTLVVHSREDFDRWQAEQIAASAALPPLTNVAAAAAHAPEHD